MKTVAQRTSEPGALGGTSYFMRYYIRHDKDAKVEGPFTVEVLTDAIRAGRVSSDALASSDLGEDISSLQSWRSCDWFPLAAIAELRGIVPPMPEPTSQPRRVSELAVFAYVASALCFSYSAVTEHGWLVCLLAVLMGFSAVDAIIRYARQREKRNAAVS